MRLDVTKILEFRKEKGLFGFFERRTRQTCRIRISLKKNPTVDQYAATLLHELLHFYTEMLEVEGVKVPAKKEHKWIYACELSIARLMGKHIGRRK